jgi:hypothetical protein
MTGAIGPIRPTTLIRSETPRSASDRRRDAAPSVNVSITVGPAAPPTTPPRPPTNLDAHLAAQQARVRGLRGGQNVLETARNTYLQTEYSGLDDRRLQVGKITKTDV